MKQTIIYFYIAVQMIFLIKGIFLRFFCFDKHINIAIKRTPYLKNSLEAIRCTEKKKCTFKIPFCKILHSFDNLLRYKWLSQQVFLGFFTAALITHLVIILRKSKNFIDKVFV